MVVICVSGDLDDNDLNVSLKNVFSPYYYSGGGGGYIKVTRMLVRKLKFTLWLLVPLMEPRTNKGGLKLKTDS